MKITDAASLGNAIRSRKKELKYTQGYISEITGLSVSFSSDLENGKLNMEEVTRADFELEAKSVSLGTKPAMKIFDEVQNRLLEALKKSAGELEEKGFAQAGEIADKIEKEFKSRRK